MKVDKLIRSLLGAGLAMGVGFEIGLFQRAFDSRSIVADGVVGSEYWIIEVDGKPTDRIEHGLLISKVPFALLAPGDRVMALSLTSHPSGEGALVEFQATIEKGVDYRILRDEKGNPALVPVKW